ncbi:MAG: hypothetical protein EPO32_07165 [Anaerolineae bacterium]|nr:MAG: hypothetical protein EPO32_07165 [Anaerolineae bacterium]
MNESTIVETITSLFPNVETTEALGFTFFFYKSERNFPFATFVASDTEHDKFSDLDRPGVYRLNIGVSKETFESLFGAGEVDASQYDFTALDVVMPHPEYAAYHFVCVLSPESSWEQVKDLLAEAHGMAARRYERQGKEG